jgi:hypothetical protein
MLLLALLVVMREWEIVVRLKADYLYSWSGEGWGRMEFGGTA